MDALARRLSEGLVDPENPAICPLCAEVDFGGYLKRDVRDTTVRSLRKNHPEFLSRIMVFLTTPHTPARDQKVIRAMKRCRNGRDLEHELMKDWESGQTGYLAAFLTLWPTSPQDLMPFGAAQSFRCLMYWLANEGSSNIPSALTGVMAYVRREFMAELDDAGVRTEFVSAICKQLETATGEQTELRGNAWGGPADRDPAYRMSYLAILIQLIATGPGSQPGSLLALVRGHEPRFLAAVLSALDACPQKMTKEQLRLFAAEIYETQGTRAGHVPADVREYAEADSLSAQTDPYRRLLNQIYHLRKTVACATPGCGVHPQDVEGGKLQRCGACHLVQYCSRECQKRHWKDAQYPHKAVCLQLKALVVDIPVGWPVEAYAQLMKTCEDALTEQEADKLARQIGPIVPPR